MAIQTPSYWKEEKYQPLVEEETIFGNKVKIPQTLQEIWKIWSPKRLLLTEEGEVVGWFKKRKHKVRTIGDLHKVFIEQYKE